MRKFFQAMAADLEISVDLIHQIQEGVDNSEKRGVESRLYQPCLKRDWLAEFEVGIERYRSE